MRKTTALLTACAASLISHTTVAQNESASERATPAAETAPTGSPEATPATAPEQAPASAVAAPTEGKIQIGVTFLPVTLGKVTVRGIDNLDDDLKFAYGVGLTAGYVVIPGLSVGLAFQAIFDLKSDKLSRDVGSSAASDEYDIMARIAYAYHVVPNLAVYAEVLPGYSIISLPSSFEDPLSGRKIGNPAGFVMVAGAGALFDITDMFFANLGIGYQMGWQSTKVVSTNTDIRTKFLRIAAGGGVKF